MVIYATHHIFKGDFMKKFFTLLAALLAFSLVGIGFVSCKDDDDNDDSSSSLVNSCFLPTEFSSKTTTALFAGDGTTSESGFSQKGTIAFYFFSDGTWVETFNGTRSVSGKTETVKESSAKGTWTTASGDFTNGTVSVIKTHEWDDDTDDWKSDSESATLTISGGKCKFNGFTLTKQSSTSSSSASALAGKSYYNGDSSPFMFTFTASEAYAYTTSNTSGFGAQAKGTYTISGTTVKVTANGTTYTLTYNSSADTMTYNGATYTRYSAS